MRQLVFDGSGRFVMSETPIDMDSNCEEVVSKRVKSQQVVKQAGQDVGTEVVEKLRTALCQQPARTRRDLMRALLAEQNKN